MKSHSDLADDMLEHAAEMEQAVLEQREEILTAFVAKYGFHPDECQQITKGNAWFVLRIDPETARAVRKSIIQQRYYAHGPTRWQRFCLRLAGLK